MADTPKPKQKLSEAKAGAAKRRGNPDRYREYMAKYMREYRARQKIKTPLIKPTGVKHG